MIYRCKIFDSKIPSVVVINALIYSSIFLLNIDAAFSIWSSSYTKGLNEIILCELIYLIAASSLLFVLLTFKLLGKVELSEEVATKLSGYIVVGLLSQGDLGVFQFLCPLLGLSVLLGMVLLLFVAVTMIATVTRTFVVVIISIISPFLTS